MAKYAMEWDKGMYGTALDKGYNEFDINTAIHHNILGSLLSAFMHLDCNELVVQRWWPWPWPWCRRAGGRTSAQCFHALATAWKWRGQQLQTEVKCVSVIAFPLQLQAPATRYGTINPYNLCARVRVRVCVCARKRMRAMCVCVSPHCVLVFI